MRIGELSKLSGVAAHTIRFYETKGLLPKSKRSRNGYRLYSDDSVQRLSNISCAKRLGFSLGDMNTVLLGNKEKENLDHDKVVLQLDNRLVEVSAMIERLESQKTEINALRSQLISTWDQGACLNTGQVNAVGSNTDKQ